MNFEGPNLQKAPIETKKTLFNNFLEKLKRTSKKISPKTLFGIALISGLSIQEIKAQKIEVPDKNAIGAYDQVKEEVNVWKNTLNNKDYKNRLIKILNNDTSRAETVIENRKDGLENSVINVLTTRDFSDSVKKHFKGIYPDAFATPKNKLINIRARDNDKIEGTTIHELSHIMNSKDLFYLTKEEEELINSTLDKDYVEKAKKGGLLGYAYVNTGEIYARLCELSYYFSSKGLDINKINKEIMEDREYSSPKIRGVLRELGKFAKVSDENIVKLLKELPLPVFENK